ncbi:MAG: magnesium and cobalt transport protein CorA [Acidobacteria bacterium]|nr:MAG: magnesium and cobalt transport protein CorA [Acidobacteriota bacterium]REK02115.1 MAG: magnesium and cobalt transport protein CorA [Acidobacteriota bacterium]REK14083.1 MAG: magnesium and cobalt transport protein CorA [Acidobacteriota bacterium]REK42078.1 MAG: magnesium and cobalt transport protein CorA [Acidobacteriota bacterium]
MEIYAHTKGDEVVRTGVDPSELRNLIARDDSVIWVDVDVRNEEDLQQAEKLYSEVFGFHYLTIEDCREARNQPKVEEFDDYLFFIVYGIRSQADTSNFTTKELDGYLGRNFVVTNRNEDFRSIDHVKQKIASTPRILEKGAAYLLHQLLDNIVDLYMPIVDDFDAAINNLEDRVYEMESSDHSILEEIMDLRRSVARLKRISTRQLEVLYKISHGEFDQIPENVLPFYRDVHDHLLRISDLAESYRDLVSGLFEIHFSVTANKTNDVMKVLAIISVTILPLTLLTGIYGMNFDNMPLLHSKWGYFITMGVMAVMFGGLVAYFWRKGWFGK